MIFLFGFILVNSCNSIKSPKLCSSEKLITVNQFNKTNVIPFQFSFINCGNDTLVIKQVTSSCGCMVVRTNSDKIQPGDSSRITGEIKQNLTDSINNETYTVAIRTNQQDTAIHFFKITVRNNK